MSDFNKTSDKSGLIQLCETFAVLGDTGISGNATLLSQFTNYINIAVGDVRSAMMRVDRTWKSDDYNYTDYPDAPITLVLSQADYTLPVSATGLNAATLLRVNGVYFILNGVRIYLRKMDNDESRYATNGIPTAYKLQGKSIFLDYQASSDALTLYTNLHIEFQRLDDPFVSGDTTQQPGFQANYHHILAFRACALYFRGFDQAKSQGFQVDFEKGLANLTIDTAKMDDGLEQNMTSERISFR